MGLIPESLPTVDPSLLLPVGLIALSAAYGLKLAYDLISPSTKAPTYDAKTGLGRGAPGFLTGSKQVRLPVEIAARIRLGEEVTAEEITEALRVQKEIEEEEARREKERLEREQRGIKRVPVGVDTDWLPAGALEGAQGGKNRRRRK